jgi:hypothetical protein
MVNASPSENQTSTSPADFCTFDDFIVHFATRANVRGNGLTGMDMSGGHQSQKHKKNG